MSRVFESCLKSLPQGCFDCVLNDDCSEMQLYEKGRKDAIDECIAIERNEELEETFYQMEYGLISAKEYEMRKLKG